MKKSELPTSFLARLTRREMIRRTGLTAVALGLAGLPAVTRAETKPRRILFFSKSSGFEHSVIKRTGDEPSLVEKILAGIGPSHGIQFTFSKDGSLFSPEYLSTFDAFVFYTTGDLTTTGTDKNPPMSPAGKAALLDAVAGGRGFVGVHSATDTFHSKPSPGQDPAHWHNDGEKTDPYIQMLGAEFIIHDRQQKGTMHVVDTAFPGMTGKDITMVEEWYSFKNFADDLHVLLVQETGGMVGLPYQRPPYPATWARRHGKGRVFYTSMGHRDETWSDPVFQAILLGGISWAAGEAEAGIPANRNDVTPSCAELPPKSPPKLPAK